MFNLWMEAGLVNGTMGIFAADMLLNPCLCLSWFALTPTQAQCILMVQFQSPVWRSWSMSIIQCSWSAAPPEASLGYCHPPGIGSQSGQSVGKKEVWHVACSCQTPQWHPPIPFQRQANLSSSQRLQERLSEDSRLQQLEWPLSKTCSQHQALHLLSHPLLLSLPATLLLPVSLQPISTAFFISLYFLFLALLSYSITL